MSGKKKKSKKALPLPKNIRDELRLTIALKGYSKIKCGGGKTLAKQEAELYKFYHGKQPNNPPQVLLLAEGSYSYRMLYDTETRNVTKKSDSEKTLYKYYLKDALTLDPARKYLAGYDITQIDLEKKNRSSKLLIQGRQLLMMARKGVKHYRKAM